MKAFKRYWNWGRSVKALLSIKPEFAEKIFSGEKGFEFRKAIFSREVSCIVLYVTAPVGKIVGEFKVLNILEDTPASLWEKTCDHAGVSKQFFFSYFKGRQKAFAIEIGSPRKYTCAIDPYAQGRKFFPPQSFRYLPEDTQHLVQETLQP